MSGATVRIRTMRTEGLSEDDAAPLLAVLDDEERARAARFAFARHRTAYVTAHALARDALAEATGAPPGALRFQPGAHGKPAALLGGREAATSFNLSHTEGMVGVAVAAVRGLCLGFDLEHAARRVGPELAAGVFRPEEREWLAALPKGQQAAGFIRLWTLKEAYVKATGRGLAADLMAFGFEVGPPPRIRFVPNLAERSDAWVFEQRQLEGGYIGAVALRRGAGLSATLGWEPLDPTALLRNLRSGAERSAYADHQKYW